MNVLNKTRTYLVGHMQYAEGTSWRNYVKGSLEEMGVIVFDPYKKPFLKDVEEDEVAREKLQEWMKNGEYDKVQERMKTVRSYDLNLVDRSDFIIAHIVPNVASWGSAEELVTANRAKKPIFLSVEGGKEKTPLWIMGMIPHKYIYNNVDEILDVLFAIDDGIKEIDSDRWRLLRENLR